MTTTIISSTSVNPRTLLLAIISSDTVIYLHRQRPLPEERGTLANVCALKPAWKVSGANPWKRPQCGDCPTFLLAAHAIFTWLLQMKDNGKANLGEMTSVIW